MPLVAVLDALAAHLAATLSPPPAQVGPAEPVTPVDLPAVVLSLEGVSSPLPGMGRIPGPLATGALRVEVALDLADPSVTFEDGSRVALLSADRRTLQLPHGTIVRADGTQDGPFGAADLSVTVNGTPRTVVAGDPGPGEVRPEPVAGVLTFGAALPASGTLRLGYFVGLWEEQAERFRGEARADAWAGDGTGADALARQVDAALAPPHWAAIAGVSSIVPVARGPVEPPDADRAGARRCRLTFRFEFEQVTPVVRTGGGPIATVAVALTPGPEQLQVTREGIPT